MNFNEFVNEVKDNIKLFLPRDYENAEVSTMECHKLNRAYTGLMVRKEGEMLTPTINLNRLYEAYKAQPGVTMETVCRKIADIVIEVPIQVDLKSILNYEDVKDKLFIRVSSAEANKEVLEIVPHQLKEDLAITYHVAVGKNQDGLSSMLITNEMMKEYGVTQEQIHEDAMKSSPRVMVPAGKIRGMEALIRWELEPYGLISPGIFMEWLEEDPCIFDLGNWILRTALKDIGRIRDKIPHFFVNVNISAAQLSRKEFRDSVMTILKETGARPEELCLELTERCRDLDVTFLKNEVDFFHSKGIKIALDDFGTGNSSLSLALELPIDELKVDMSFIKDIEHKPQNQLI